jgi:hypothetical protein
MNYYDKNKEKNSLFINQREIDTLPNIIKINNYSISKRNRGLRKNYKSLGQIILERKRHIENTKNQIHNSFYKILNSLNESLYLSELVRQKRPKFDNINIKTIFSPDILDKIKKEKYNKKWHLYETYTNFRKSNSIKIIKDNSIKKQKSSEKENKKEKIVFLNKTNTTKRLLPPKKIVKICKSKLYNDNKLMKYSLYLNNNIDYYIESQEQNSGFYDFDKQLRSMIKETKIGIDFPGNSMERNVLSYIKTINPKNITSKHTKNHSVPDRTFIPIPDSLIGTKFSHITKRDVYNYRNKIY